MVLLGVLILIISYIQSYFPPKEQKRYSADFTAMGEYHRSSARYGNTVLLVFLYSAVYRIYKRRLTTWSYILLFDFFADG